MRNSREFPPISRTKLRVIIKKMKIFDEKMELSGFSEQEIIDVGEYIFKDVNKVDTFFALPKAFGGL